MIEWETYPLMFLRVECAYAVQNYYNIEQNPWATSHPRLICPCLFVLLRLCWYIIIGTPLLPMWRNCTKVRDHCEALYVIFTTCCFETRHSFKDVTGTKKYNIAFPSSGNCINRMWFRLVDTLLSSSHLMNVSLCDLELCDALYWCEEQPRMFTRKDIVS